MVYHINIQLKNERISIVMNSQQISRTVKLIGDCWMVPGKSYPKPLPSELAPWYLYLSDSGHSLVCCLKSYYKAEGDLTPCLLPVSVKTVLRNYEILRGFIVVDEELAGCQYSSTIGLVQPQEDYEF